MAPRVAKIRLLAIAPPEPRKTAAHDGTPTASRTRISTGSTTARTITAKQNAGPALRQSSNRTERDGRLPWVVVRRSPASVAAMAATPTHTIRSGIVSAIARVTSYSAANAVNTSVVYTRTRSRPGTPNSETARTKMRSAAASAPGAASGSVMRRNTRRGEATIRAASSRRPSIRRMETSVASIDSG